jgi:pSer/pThr/pTyr-binding forkhead associated (FHA) protein
MGNQLKNPSIIVNFLFCLFILFSTSSVSFAQESVSAIIELKNSPDVYHNRPVRIKGRIVETQIAPRGLTTGHYIIEDNTGRLPVRTSKLPAPNELVEVWGQLLKDQDEPYFMHIHENKRCCPEFDPSNTGKSKSKEEKTEKKETENPFKDLSPTVLIGLGLIVLSIIGLIVFLVLKSNQKKQLLLKQENERRDSEQKRREVLMMRMQQGGATGASDQTLVPGQNNRAGSIGDATTVGYPVGKLVVMEGPEQGKSYSVMAPKTIIGKQSGLGGVLNQSQDPLISKVHAEILATAFGNCTLVDKQSRNGTRLNGHPVSETALNENDLIEIGNSKLKFSLVSANHSPPKTDSAHSGIDDKTVIRNVNEQATIVRRLPSLEILIGPDQGKIARMVKQRWLVGRSKEADLVLSDTTVSRQQFSLELRGEHIYLIPLSEQVPIQVEDQVISTETLLEDKAEISFGDTRLRFLKG